MNDGGSFTPLTVIEKVWIELVSWPPLPVPPSSTSFALTVAEPFWPEAEVKVSVPVGLIAGSTEKRLLLSFVTTKDTVWLDSLAGPSLIAVAQPVTV